MSVWRVKQGFAMEEQVGSPKYSFSAEKTTCTRIFVGHFVTIMAHLPKVGATMTGIDSSLTIATFDPERGPGGKGTITIVMEGPTKDVEDKTSEGTYEIEWSEVEKALETHPRYASVAEKYMALAQAYFATTDTAERAQIYAQINSVRAKEYITKRLKGTESYVIYIPIARRNRETTIASLTGDCGLIESPGFAVPAGYQWMKSAHRVTRTGRRGKFAIQEEWTGLTLVDTDLYPVPKAPVPE